MRGQKSYAKKNIHRKGKGYMNQISFYPQFYPQINTIINNFKNQIK